MLQDSVNNIVVSSRFCDHLDLAGSIIGVINVGDSITGVIAVFGSQSAGGNLFDNTSSIVVPGLLGHFEIGNRIDDFRLINPAKEVTSDACRSLEDEYNSTVSSSLS